MPPSAIVRERCSLSTRDNARFSAALLARRGLSRAAVVTCAWHLPRALSLFSRAGIESEAVAAEAPGPPSWRTRVWLWSREGILGWLDSRPMNGARP